jgi:hypothetical protein
MNPAALMKIMGMKKQFDASHPRFGAFLSAVGRDSLVEGTIIEISVKNPQGDEKVTNIKLNESDIEMFRELQKLGQ